jgi:hypothetical protein
VPSEKTGGAIMSNNDWSELADDICATLTLAYGKSRIELEQQARQRGCTCDQLIAAALTELARRRVEQALACQSGHDQP